MTWIDDLKAKYSMFDGISPYNFEVGEGWREIIETLCKDLDDLHIPNMKVVQIKEKFGGLRFYTSTHSTPEEYTNFPKEHLMLLEKMYKLTSVAEEKSTTVCETCGNPGSGVTIKGWMSTLCLACRKRKLMGK